MGRGCIYVQVEVGHMKEMQLSISYYDCPLSWQNFIDSIQTDPLRDVSVDEINSELSVFAARCYPATLYTKNAVVKFATIEDYVMFILRWGK